VLWLAANYGFSGWAGIAGLVWLLGRVGYAWGYMRNPASREPGFAVAMLAWLAVLVMAAVGVCRALMLG
jgi:glutathione S-transferase